MQIPDFKVIGATHIKEWIKHHPHDIFALVQHAYTLHANAQAINPDSYFLRFPNDNKNRIIALPASLEDQMPVAGIKWIASFPDNIGADLDRASAVLIVNDRNTGYPLACLEGSLISATRTAAAAALGAHYLHATPNDIGHLSVVGAGLIAYETLTLLSQLGWKIARLTVVDTSEQRSLLFAAKCRETLGLEVDIATLEQAIPQSDMVLFATSAGTPYVHDTTLFAHAPTVLHMSLRDLSEDIILAAQNIVDDTDHCLKAQTSLHLTQQRVGTRDFVAGNAADLISGRLQPDFTRTRIFSPFGMGILDLALARAILHSLDDAELNTISGFFPFPYAA